MVLTVKLYGQLNYHINNVMEILMSKSNKQMLGDVIKEQTTSTVIDFLVIKDVETGKELVKKRG